MAKATLAVALLVHVEGPNMLALLPMGWRASICRTCKIGRWKPLRFSRVLNVHDFTRLPADGSDLPPTFPCQPVLIFLCFIVRRRKFRFVHRQVTHFHGEGVTDPCVRYRVSPTATPSNLELTKRKSENSRLPLGPHLLSSQSSKNSTGSSCDANRAAMEKSWSACARRKNISETASEGRSR